MNRYVWASLVTVAVLSVGLVGVAGAGSLSDYAINWDVLASGGSPSSAGGIELNATLGQTAIGWSEGALISTGSGYWAGEVPAPSPTLRQVYLPLLSRRHQAVPDLVVEGLRAGSQGAIVVIRNRAEVASTDDFWVDVYFDPDQVPSLNQPWDTIADHGLVWGVTDDLAPGESLILITNDQYFWPKMSSSAPLPLGVEVYAFVDSVDFETDYGAVLENAENNNLGGPVLSAIQTDCCQATGDQMQVPVQAELPERQ